MKIIITNTVTLNGGDFAILDALMNLLKQTYGDNTTFIVYDNDPEVASRYYPDIHYRKLLYLQHQKKATGRSKLSRIGAGLYNKLTKKRFLLAASYYASGRRGMARLMLTKKQREDFDIYTSADIFISTGGTYLVENYNLMPRYFDYDITLALQKPLVFFTQSLGPYRKPVNQRAIKRIFDQASLILLRDEASLKNLQAIQVNVAKAKVCADVVFADADPVILEKARTRALGQPLRVGISVRDWSFFKERSAKEGMATYNQSVAAVCEYITGELGGEVLFLSTCQGIAEYGKDDAKAAARIYGLLSEAARKRTVVNGDFHGPEELKQQIKALDIVISTRMHFAIQSLAVGVPVLPIAYEFKTKELFGKLLPPAYILDIDTIEPGAAVAAFKQLVAALPGIRADLFARVDQERQSALKPIHYLKEALPAFR